MVNLLIITIIGFGAGLNAPTSLNDIDDNSTEITYKNVKDVNKFSVSKSALDSAEIPSWFSTTYLLINGLWISMIIIGWVRGVS
jgi:hypothetical protein